MVCWWGRFPWCLVPGTGRYVPLRDEADSLEEPDGAGVSFHQRLQVAAWDRLLTKVFEPPFHRFIGGSRSPRFGEHIDVKVHGPSTFGESSGRLSPRACPPSGRKWPPWPAWSHSSPDGEPSPAWANNSTRATRSDSANRGITVMRKPSLCPHALGRTQRSASGCAGSAGRQRRDPWHPRGTRG